MMFKNRVVALATVMAFAAAASLGAQAQKAAKQDEKKRSKQEQQEIETLVKLVDGVMAGQPAPSDVKMTVIPYFLKSQENRTFVPFVLNVQNAPTADVAMYVRVVSPTPAAETTKEKDKKKVEYPWDDIHFVPAAQMTDGNPSLNRVFMAVPGTYDVYIAMKERLPEKAPREQVAKTSVHKTQIEVPDFNNGELSTSSIVVTDKVNMLTAPVNPDEARERPFVFGSQELVPAADTTFGKGEELSIFFQVYNAGLGETGKPDLTMEYNFHKKEGEVEKFFNKTNPQNMNASNMPAEFDPAKFPVPGGITVPLKTFPEGEYRLEIKITDKASGKTLTRDVPFSVTPA